MSALEKIETTELMPAQPAHVPVVVETANLFDRMIERVLMDPSLSIERLQQLLDMRAKEQDRVRQDEALRAKKAYFAAMSRCQAELPVVIKNQKNTHTSSKYADLAAIETQAMPIIHSYGFGVSFQPDGYNDKGELQIKWKVFHEEGHSESDIAGIPLDSAGAQGKVNKTGTQAFGSTATYGRRYLLCMIFNISTGDDKDGNAATKPQALISDDQYEQIAERMTALRVKPDDFLKRFQIESFDELPAKRFDEAMQLFAQREQIMAKAREA